jgi:threonine/homoserine/homoserine lactone efflux protein
MAFHELLVYILFVIGFALTPGPNMMLYLTYTFEFGRKAGWATAAGIVSAFVIHILFLIMGITAILVASPGALILLRYAGIAYLFFLAYRNLKVVKWAAGNSRTALVSLPDFYVKGFISNLLNPGSLFLYFSLIPQFLHPERGHFLAQNLLLGVLQMIFSFATNCSIIFFAGLVSASFLKSEKYQRVTRYVMSFFIVVFALRMLYAGFN